MTRVRIENEEDDMDVYEWLYPVFLTIVLRFGTY
jgi:hypothetical protein